VTPRVVNLHVLNLHRRLGCAYNVMTLYAVHGVSSRTWGVRFDGHRFGVPWGIQRFHGVSVSLVGVTCQNPHNRARLANLKGSRRGTCVGTSRRFFRRSGAKGPEAQKLPEPPPGTPVGIDRRQRGKGSSVQRRAFVSVGLNNPCEVVDLVSQPRDLIQ